MIDKLNVELDVMMPLRREFSEYLDAVRHDPKQFDWRPNEHYQAVGNLSEFGIEGLFHGWYRHPKKEAGKVQTHKLEFFETGKMSLGDVVADLERIVDVDPRKLRVMRLDLCADFRDVKIEYFYKNLHFKFKRRGAHFDGDCYLEKYSSDGGETIYYGAQPNLYRCYNKTAERQRAYKLMQRRANPDAELPSFEQWCGLKDGQVLTRVERQINGKRDVPDSVNTIGKLEQLPEFNPFDRAVVLREQYDAKFTGNSFYRYAAKLYVKHLIEERGLDYARMWVRQYAPANPSRTWKEMTSDLSASADAGPSSTQMYEQYRESVTKQLVN